ncbi:MAG: SDR family oxidoreductase [Flavobacteriaceae bacterium]|nr:SDR family oxidoreductase [Flavobacteriaceae bacterium]
MNTQNQIKPKVIVTGSEGLIGKSLCASLENTYDVIRIDIKLGYDLKNQQVVIDIMKQHSDSVGLVNLFSINPQPINESENLMSLSLSSVKDYLDVNVLALFSVCREFARFSENKASIVNFSSIYGVSSPKHFIYNANFTKHIGYTISKSAVLGMSKYLATYLAPKIRVNTIIPGGIRNNQDEFFLNEYSKMSPMKRLMDVDEIVSSVSYLLSKDSSYTTGSEIHVDGGWTAW